MATKKKRRRSSTTPTAARPASARPAPVRRDKKAAKREAQERARKAAARKGALRRALIGGFVGLLVFAAISWFNRPPSPTPFRDHTDALNASIHAGCGDVVTPSADPQRTHLEAGASYDYPEHPPTSGPHDPTPLPDEPRVYDDVSTYRETQAVHSLEHGSVIIYYRPSSDPQGLPGNVVDALKPVAEQDRATYLIPYSQLPSGTALAYTAWNKLLRCSADITPNDAVAVAEGFVASFACTSNAPEGKSGPGC
jgi:Protein of unknown function (DUF3105)